MNAPVSTPPRIIPDERQQEAIAHVTGPMLVIAGAGTGKTTVLARRVASLIRDGHAQPAEILALTYTEAAAAEMLSRVRRELEGTSSDGLQASTFHAWCFGLLQRRGLGFGVVDDQDLWIFLRRRIRELHLRHFVRAANVAQFLSGLTDFIRRCQDELVSPEDYARYVTGLERGEFPLPRVTTSKKQAELTDSEILDRCREIAQVYATVERMLREKNLGTFGHMITRAYQLLKDDPRILEEERRRTRFLLVDEFQDANVAQIEVLALLAGPDRNVFAVGDPDQSIYTFRGASNEAFTLFVRKFPDPKVVVLGKNRRSLLPILRCAFGIVNENPAVFPQQGGALSYQRAPLESSREEQARLNGDSAGSAPVQIVTWADNEMEASDLARHIQKKRKAEKRDWKDFAVIYRLHSHRGELVKELAARGIPFSIEGLDILDTPEVRDAMACLAAALSPNDASSLFRVAALPQFGIRVAEFRAALRGVRRQELDMPAVLNKLAGGPAVVGSVAEIHRALDKEEILAIDALRAVIRHFQLPRTPLLDGLVKFVEAWQRKAVVETGSPSEFLEYLDYFVQAKGAIALPGSAGDAVQLLTAHAAKGLEFPHAAIIRGSSPWFPQAFREPLIAFPAELRASKLSPAEDKALKEEEERRLFYVAMTRARDTLAIYAHKGRGTKNVRPTEFLRTFMERSAYKPFWAGRSAAAVQDSLFAEEEQRFAFETSNVAAWLLMESSADFVKGLSASAIETYEQCPLRFKLEREWNLPRDVSAALHYGSAMHGVLRTFYDAQRMGRAVTEAQLLEDFRSALASAGIADRYQYELYLRQGGEQLRQFLDSVREGAAPVVLETERQFELQVGETKLLGRIDRIDRVGGDAVAIVDYKTGKAKTQEDADQSLQLSLYALAVKEILGKRADRLVFQNLENNSVIVTTRNDAQIEEAKLRVAKAWEGISKGKFDPEIAFHCSFCPYRNLCPATEKVITTSSKRVN